MASTPEALATVAAPLSASGKGASASGTASTLVLYDTSGDWGWLGELYGVATANLASHFGYWTAEPATSYTCGQIASFQAVIYLGSSYDEPLPTCLLDDVLASTRPVVWSYFNSWQLVARAGGSASFIARYGFDASYLDFSSRFSSVRYGGRVLARYPDNVGVMMLDIRDPARAHELATAVREDGTTAPYAVRSGQLTMVGDIPFSYMSERDRVLVFEDLLFDALAPTTVARHRALVRLEDIDASTDPDSLYEIADYLSSNGVPFGFAVIADYRDPTGYYNDGVAQELGLEDVPDLVDALLYMQDNGGVLIEHGFTHQWDGGANPYDGVSADDTEFFRVTEEPNGTVDFVGPLPEDSVSWALGRMESADTALLGAGLGTPTIFEFPHYTASANSYAAAAAHFTTRWDRVLYFSGQLGGGAIDSTRWMGQLFPYLVRDVYGTLVLPENLGNIEPDSWNGLPPHLPADVIAAADRNLVVRDGVVGLYFHPFLPISYLQDCVEGVSALGYTFVSPNDI